jgi:hypothetical protein
MHRCLVLLISAMAMFGARAQDGDPLSSPDCRAALARLQEALAQAPRQSGKPDRAVVQAQRQAAQACLGRDTGQRTRSGAPEPPLTVPPTAIAPPRAARESRPIVVPSTAPLPPRAAAITACDPAGCWDSDGRRLNNAGPVLLGPRGACVVQAGQVSCP